MEHPARAEIVKHGVAVLREALQAPEEANCGEGGGGNTCETKNTDVAQPAGGWFLLTFSPERAPWNSPRGAIREFGHVAHGCDVVTPPSAESRHRLPVHAGPSKKSELLVLSFQSFSLS